MSAPTRFDHAEACIDWLLERVGPRLVVGCPLGLGKPNILLNALYRRAEADAGIDLTIITALSLQTPRASGELERRLVEPLRERIFEDYPDLDYVAAMQADALPANIRVSEFFFQPGAMLGRNQAQRHYRSTNYTHVGRDLMDAGVNVLMQMVAPHADGSRVSLSSNPDVTLELLPEIARRRESADEPLVVLGQANPQMPYLGRDAEIDAGWFDAMLHGEFKPFGAPAMAISDADYSIGLHASTLLADAGTLQIGIGALSDAIAYCANLRQGDNPAYRQLAEPIAARYPTLIEAFGGLQPFEHGLYGCTEMLVDAYLQLWRGGVLKRRVYDDVTLQRLLDAGEITSTVTGQTLRALIRAGRVSPELTAADVDWLVQAGVFRPGLRWQAGEITDGEQLRLPANAGEPDNFRAMSEQCLGDELAHPTLIHGGFFLGPTDFYDRLRALSDADRALVCMTGVNEINQLYGNEPLRRAQRRHARFINTALKATLMGSVASDGLENGEVLSGVGGQYNFVSQAQELADGRSIICVRATRGAGKSLESNIVWHYGHTTIPRHLRDIVISEYGIADLRGKTDTEVVAAMIEIADSRFQPELIRQARAGGKLSEDYQLPDRARRNTPAAVRARLAEHRAAGGFPLFPFGSDFTDEEIVLGRALRGLAALSKPALARAALRHAGALISPPDTARPCLERMQLAEPATWKERGLQRAVVLALAVDGATI